MNCKNISHQSSDFHIFLITGMFFLFFGIGCSPLPHPPVPEKLIKELTISILTYDYDFQRYHLYQNTEEGSPVLSKDPTTANICMEKMQNGFTYKVFYKGNKATVVTDISKTGIVEWINVNRLRIPAKSHFERDSKVQFFMIYEKGNWYFATFGGLIPAGWPVPDDSGNT